MTEDMWLLSKNGFRLFESVWRQSERKSRLFVIACCRTSPYVNGLILKALNIAEQGGDPMESESDGTLTDQQEELLHIAQGMSQPELWEDMPRMLEAILPQNQEYAMFLRDIFGNPFRPVTLLPEWRTSTVLALATGIYEEKAFDRMPILADALQDSGCTNEDILNHCRSETVHTRGCWCVDLLLSKE